MPEPTAEILMNRFAEETGIVGTSAPRRYLWTDAFALCNFLDLHGRTGLQRHLDLAFKLVEQVHHTLGRHRPDDIRSGWISGLLNDEGELHPTIGGLRIGKDLPEREPGKPVNELLEWERDGQYFHYLTKWMHALHQLWRRTGDQAHLRWALELAKTAHARFTYTARSGMRRMYWKMSIDLTRPLVPSMGQHDPLDALVTYAELQAAGGMLESEVSEMEEISKEIALETTDPLGIGGLLFDAVRIAQLGMQRDFLPKGLLERVTDAALVGLVSVRGAEATNLPAAHRLPFRELGLSIGLHGIRNMREWVTAHPEKFSSAVGYALERLSEHLSVGETIEHFWLDQRHRESPTWREHADINTVMLATSLAPDGYLSFDMGRQVGVYRSG